MRHHKYAIKIRNTLEKDIKKILIETKHITKNDCVILNNQIIGIFPLFPHNKYEGTFKVQTIDNLIKGEIEVKITIYGLTHHIITGRPLYDIKIDYEGETIINKGRILEPKYQITPRIKIE
jgi:hypothetical protein